MKGKLVSKIRYSLRKRKCIVANEVMSAEQNVISDVLQEVVLSLSVQINWANENFMQWNTVKMEKIERIERINRNFIGKN